MSERDINTIGSWLRKHVSQVQYGQLVITVTIHDGQVRKVDKTVTESVRPYSKATET